MSWSQTAKLHPEELMKVIIIVFVITIATKFGNLVMEIKSKHHIEH